MICKEELVRRFDDYVRYFNAYCTSDVEDHEMLKAVLAMLKEQEKPNGKCVNECECWDSAYERGKHDALKEQDAVKPEREHSGGGTTWWNVCGNCKTAINPNDKFCHECGKPILWEGR